MKMNRQTSQADPTASQDVNLDKKGWAEATML
jgi:hypothetical protein